MRDINQEVEALSPQKRAMFEALLQKKKASRASDATIPRRSVDEGLPLSFAQQRLWFLDQIEPGNTFYNMASAVRLSGHLDIAVLEQSLNEIVRRHETLRTTFATVEALPVQVIAPTQSIPLPVLDIQPYPEEQRETEAQRLAQEEAQRPFDLARGPLIRTTLLHLDTSHHILLVTMHHIISDGWSNGVLIREMAAIYPAFLQRQPCPLPELPIQYADYALWQRQQTAMIEGQLAYWKQQLADVPNLNLPTDRPRPSAPSYRGARHTVCLSRQLSDAINDFNRQEGVTLYMTLLAALQTLLLRYTRQTDFAIGSPIANRKPTEVENLIGFFFITLVMRADLAGNPSFRELLQRVRQTALDAYNHQDVPFEQIVDSLQLPRHLRQNPLFQVMLILQNMPMGQLALPGLTIESWVLDHGASQFDLSLYAWESEDGLVTSWQYNTDLFRADTIARMAGHLERLLGAMIAHPERRLAALPILSEAETENLLQRWNAPGAPHTPQPDVVEQFEAQASRQADAVAITFENQSMSYGRLNAEANQLAHHLKKLGVGPETPVGLYLERSPAMISSILAILKAGGAYLFMDPAYPPERTAFALNDTLAPVVLTQQHLAAQLPPSQANVICLDTGWPEIAQHSAANPNRDVTPRNAAYIIYTSGSTGRPKGVVIERHSLANFTQAAIQAYALGSEERVLQFASLSWDTSIEEIFPTLASGGGLILRSDAMLGSTTAFWQKCQEWQVSAINLPSAYWHELVLNLQADADYIPACLRLVIIGGERALPERLQTWQKHVGKKVRIVNTYGATEATAVTTQCELNLLPEGTHTVPIGRPFANAQVYILDAEMQPTPVGVAGELCISGEGLSRGYLHHPDLSAQKFVCNPFSTQPGERLYRTGDQARYLPDGQIEFFGRMDHQVKIRGQRVEADEIESLLRQHPAVQDALIVPRDDAAGQKCLAAYVITRQPPGDPHELRDFLKKQLPDFMLPASFTFLEMWPLTPNGKVNRNALPEPDRPQATHLHTPPGTHEEKLLAEIWCEVLGIQQVGIHDNFFELGGHSLLATQVLTRIRTAFQAEIPLRALFEAPTIAALANQLQSAKQASLSPETLAIPISAETITAEQVDGLSDEQVTALLKELLDE